MKAPVLDPSVLALDPVATADAISQQMLTQLSQVVKRRGFVVGVSGGIDSSVCAALAVRAVGKHKVLLLLMPEADSSGTSERLGRMLAAHLGCEVIKEDLEASLRGLGCYERRDAAVRSVFPDYGPGWKMKITLPEVSGGQISFYSLVVETPTGERKTARLPLTPYLEIVACTNMKQRSRTLMEYFHADRLNYAVVGTPNRLEYDQGFFVKYGDSAADIKPIAHLYKQQVYALARGMGLPDEICSRTPTTDTYSLEQGQDEFYWRLPYDQMDLCLYGHNHGIPAAEVAAGIDRPVEVVERAYKDIEQKRKTTLYLQLHPLLCEEVGEIDHAPHAGAPGAPLKGGTTVRARGSR